MASLAFGGLALASCGKLKELPDAVARAPGFRRAQNRRAAGFGPLIVNAAPDAVVDLPARFNCKVISKAGECLENVGVVPDAADGMGSFLIDRDRVALVRNHELRPSEFLDGPFGKEMHPNIPVFDRLDGRPLPGGTTTIVYNHRTGETERQYLSLAGTIRNCAGGVTPWGTWLTCEEDVTRARRKGDVDHGWVFEVPADHGDLVKPIALTAMGRFNHEAAAVDPRTGIVYLTEDRLDGLFYRFLPHVRTVAPDGTMHAKLAEGGKLQALALAGDYTGVDARNWATETMPVGLEVPVRWVDLEKVESPDRDDLRIRGHQAGATRFANGEGIHFGVGELYFCATSGGAIKSGQIMRYRPFMNERDDDPSEGEGAGSIELFLESSDPATFNFGDNLAVAPNGHLVVCEDPYWGGQGTYLPRMIDAAPCYVRGVTPDGAIYDIARLHGSSEFAGACFSPDGKTLFVNVMNPTQTLAITASDDSRWGQAGPWGEPLPGWKVYDAAASV